MFEEFLRNTQKLLTEDIKRFKATMDASLEMMCLTEKGLAVYVNTSWTIFTGRPLEKELGNGRFDLIHLDDYDITTESIFAAFLNKTQYRIKYRMKDFNDEYIWVVEDGIPIFSSTQVLLGFVSKCINIDNETKLELKLQSAEIKYRSFFEAAHDGILILDSTTGEITDVNPFLKKLLGYSQDEFLGKKLWEVGAFKNIEASKDTFKVLQSVGYVRYDDLPLETKNGKLIPVEFVSNIYSADGVNVIQCNIRDISERKKIEEAEKALLYFKQEQQKNMFIADVTHELRTPLAIIKGNVELALRDKKIPQEETFESINIEINHLSAMLLDLAILTTDNKSLQKDITTQKVDVLKIIKTVVKRLLVISAQKQTVITLDKTPSVYISGDVSYLEKLFSNIISNAIYYGKNNGSVYIHTEITKHQAVFLIQDDGIGISKEDLPNIFGRFYRSNEAREVNREGTGLGLAISKWIVEAHLGEISVESAVGKGTTFKITFPLFSQNV
jgi:PAS domain S-box-containing protein